jgi:hypothetical protein
MRLLAVVSFLAGLGVSNALAQEGEAPPVSFPTLAATGADAKAFVPEGWKLESEIKGDLDKDGTDDLALVLRMADPANVIKPYEGSNTTLDTNPRMLAVALAGKDGRYRLAFENHTLIPRNLNSSQEDPLSEMGGVTVENGTLKVALYLFMSAGGWDMGNTRFTFRIEKEKLRLIGYDSSNVNRGSGIIEEVSINLLTGKVILTTGSISEDEGKSTVKKLKANLVVTIDGLGEWGEGFTPDY